VKFSELDLHKSLQDNLTQIQFVECTPIQQQAIPHLLAGRDIAGLAQTGTGKTGAFLIPLVDRVLMSIDAAANSPESASNEESQVEVGSTVEPSGERPPLRFFPNWRRRNYVLVLVPTRELAEQVFENAQMLLMGTSLKAVAVYGGTTYEKQKAAFRNGVEFVIATPGRLIDLYKENLADLRQVRAVVFDEADRMFDMGFKDDMKFILRRIPRERQFLVFSATLNFEVLNTAYEFGAFPVEINISKDQPKAENVDDEIFHIGEDEKPRYLLSLIKKTSPHQTIVFSNFKRNVERITKFLNDHGLPAVAISSLLTQAQRNRVMAQFKSENNQNILVATDLAARGLDILGVDLVMNYELPDDPENYVHRIGRTGRAGQKGRAFSLVCDRDVDALSRIEDYVGHKVNVGWVDESELVDDVKPLPRESFDRDRKPMPRRGDSQRPRSRDRDRDRGRDRDRREGGGHRSNRRPGQGSHGTSQQARPQHRRDQAHPQGQGHGEGQNLNRSGQSRGGHGNRHRSDAKLNQERRFDGRRPNRHNRPYRGPNRSQRPHRPSAPAASASSGSLGQKVTGFFKKLFGKD